MTERFEKQSRKILSSRSFNELITFLTQQPDYGDIIPGTSGVRKLRWKTGNDNRGKSGGVRILYHYSKGVLVLLITLYSKTNQDDITQQQKNELRSIVPALVAAYKNEVNVS